MGVNLVINISTLKLPGLFINFTTENTEITEKSY